MTEDWGISGWRRLARDMEVQQREWQETVERVLRPNRQLEETLRHMQDALRPDRQLEETLRHMQNVMRPDRQLEESLRHMQDALRPDRQLQESLRHIQVGPVDLVESLEASQRQLRALFEKQQQEFQRSQGVLVWQQLSTSVSELQTTLRHLIDMNASAFGAGDLSVGPDGEVLVAGEATPPKEVAASLAHLTEELAAASTLSDYLRRLWKFLDSLRGPLAAILLHVLLPYLIAVVANLTTPMIQDYWKHFVGTSRQEAVLAIQEAAQSRYDSTHLERYRFVTATRLRVHAGSEEQDDVIAEIAFGKVVMILESKGRRTLVEFLDDARNESCRGWVTSRYLAAFSK